LTTISDGFLRVLHAVTDVGLVLASVVVAAGCPVVEHRLPPDDHLVADDGAHRVGERRSGAEADGRMDLGTGDSDRTGTEPEANDPPAVLPASRHQSVGKAEPRWPGT